MRASLKTIHKIIHGDSRQMNLLADKSVHIVITSPPYWQLKDYGTENQIGFHDSYESYINNLNLVWKECHRVLHSGCRLCINIGDQFARSVYYGRYKVIPIRTEIIKFCETIGFDYMGAVSGTTSLAARNLGRNSVGYEINPDFISTIKTKLNVGQSDLVATEYIFQEDSIKTDLNKEIENLPYIFKDPHKLNKKIDPKKFQFGSRIDKDCGDREVYYSVKEVISSELVRLNNDLIVRLIGVKEKEAANGQAIKYLTEKTKGQKVFMKFDDQKYDDKNNLLCYLYLSNKTFINAHIIKEGLADVDRLSDFKYKKKFTDLQRH